MLSLEDILLRTLLPMITAVEVTLSFMDTLIALTATTTAWFVDTETLRQTDRQTDTLKTIPAFTITAGIHGTHEVR